VERRLRVVYGAVGFLQPDAEPLGYLTERAALLVGM